MVCCEGLCAEVGAESFVIIGYDPLQRISGMFVVFLVVLVRTKGENATDTRYFLDNIAVPGTTNTITIECSGVVKVGYEVEDIEIKVDNDSLKIYISLPEAQVLDNYVIWDTVRCQEENNILNPIDFEQYQDIISEIETEGLALAEADGIYEDAEANMETIICNFLSGFEDYEIVFL